MTNNEQEKPTPAPQGTRSGLIVAALFLVAACAVVLYGIRAHGGKEASNQCVDARPVAARVAPLARGQVAAMSVPATPRPAIDVSFNDPAGKKTDLSAFRGKTILLNLWATWCIPCREEMPALDRLQARLGGPNFEVVAVNIDTVRLDKRKAFLQEAGVTHLNFYAEKSREGGRLADHDAHRAGRL
jgi:thiol-disulfide isomerase/thioredoxin